MAIMLNMRSKVYENIFFSASQPPDSSTIPQIAGIADGQLVCCRPGVVVKLREIGINDLCINIPSPPAGIHSAVRDGLRVTFAHGGTATHGRSCGRDANLVVAGDYGSFFNLGNASLGQNNCFQVQICGSHAVGTTFVVDIHGKVHPAKPDGDTQHQISHALTGWSNNVTSNGYSASFKPASHCRVTAAFLGGPWFAQICRTQVTIVD